MQEPADVDLAVDIIEPQLDQSRPLFDEVLVLGELLEEAETRGILKLERDEKSGGFIIKSRGAS